ncbi:uncharacterized protein LOC119027207 [Acanthopagrus latus]|uniref:uncharacterized protein LOC119027207 n=1 Tax=Acanthopagrus latus TaxID=8177 RepID=UPI00187C2A34|nr:uncharacterized protein LOC119027207 [Acanthopagrus latus]
MCFIQARQARHEKLQLPRQLGQDDDLHTEGGMTQHDQHYYGRGNGGYQYYSFDYFDYPDRRRRVCHCGWTKETTYHGLRIHQGRMGCTPKGRRIPESEQAYWKSQWEMRQRTNQPAVWVEERDQHYNNNLDRLPRVCHCGWSKVTTYHGLRTHQGRMECTPKGRRIPESEQAYWKRQWEMKQGHYQPAESMRPGFYMRET